MNLTAKQIEALKAVDEGRLTWVSVNGGGTFSVIGYHHNTLLSLIERDLLNLRQDEQRFWKYRLTLTDTGRKALADN